MHLDTSSSRTKSVFLKQLLSTTSLLVPLEIVYAFDDPNDTIATFNRLVAEENKGDPIRRALVKLSEYSLPASELRKSTLGGAHGLLRKVHGAC